MRLRLTQIAITGVAGLLLLASCAKPQDAWQAHQNAGEKAAKKKDYLGAIKEFEVASQIATAQVSVADHQDKAHKIAMMERLSASKAALAKLKMDGGDLVDAHQILIDLLNLKMKIGVLQGNKKNNESVATVLSALSTCAYDQGKFAEAEAYAQQAYDARLIVLGPNHPHVALAANNLAEIYQKEGKDDLADKMFTVSLETFKRSGSKTGMLDVLNNVAMFYKKLGKIDEARAVIETALELGRTDPNADDTDVAMTLNALGALNKSLYEYPAAEQNYRDAIAILERDKKGNASSLCEALDNYADMLVLEDKDKEAEGVYRQAIEMCVNSKGALHPDLAERLYDLGALMKDQSRLPEAEEFLKRALVIQQHAYDADSPILMQTVYRLSAVYELEKKYKEASALYEDMLPKLIAKRGPDHPYVADFLENWAAMLKDNPIHSEQVKQLVARAKTIRGKTANGMIKNTNLNINPNVEKRRKPTTPPNSIMAPKEEES